MSDRQAEIQARVERAGVFADVWLPVRLSAYLTKPGPPQTVRRSWRERLFTRPWRPLRATTTFTPQVPSDEVLQTPDGFIMHPETWKKLKAMLPETVVGGLNAE